MKAALRLAVVVPLAYCSVDASTNEVRMAEVKIGTNVYRNATITKRTPLDAVVRYDGGIAKVKLSDLPEDLKAKWIDKEAVSEFQQSLAQSAEDTKKANAEAYSRAMRAKLSSGVLRVCCDRLYDFSELDGLRYNAVPTGLKGNHVRGRVLQVLDDGVMVKAAGWDRVFLQNYPTEGLVDDSFVNCAAIQCGTYSYVNTLGAKTTVPKYDFGVTYSPTKHPRFSKARLLKRSGGEVDYPLPPEWVPDVIKTGSITVVP